MLDRFTTSKSEIHTADLVIPTPEKKSPHFSFDFDSQMTLRDWASLDSAKWSFMAGSGDEAIFFGSLKTLTNQYPNQLYDDYIRVRRSQKINRSIELNDNQIRDLTKQSVGWGQLQGKSQNEISEENWQTMKRFTNLTLNSSVGFNDLFAAPLAETMIAGKMLYPDFEKDQDWIQDIRQKFGILFDTFDFTKNSSLYHLGVTIGAAYKFLSPKGDEKPLTLDAKSKQIMTSYEQVKKHMRQFSSHNSWGEIMDTSLYMQILSSGEVHFGEQGFIFVDPPVETNFEVKLDPVPRKRLF